MLLATLASANAATLSGNAALTSHYVDYVTTPFGARELMARVRVLLRLDVTAAEAAPEFDDGRLHIDLHAAKCNTTASRSCARARSRC